MHSLINFRGILNIYKRRTKIIPSASYWKMNLNSELNTKEQFWHILNQMTMIHVTSTEKQPGDLWPLLKQTKTKNYIHVFCRLRWFMIRIALPYCTSFQIYFVYSLFFLSSLSLYHLLSDIKKSYFIKTFFLILFYF